ncbi:hypothetical protein PUR57_19150 [Streptomyces sp. JV176]|uniref:hypothetical protein n=1 Tax=Streptomyces sp. JV176 TaxID=858630 RepID=UPI002E78F429|nr:hypothetical protein [Streptomyces sp. JV176]MEE1800764.1 hypothetical protein [Streptomyces sp. JV176]
MIPGRWCRVVRAAVFAATCVLLAALGHVRMSGTAVPWWAMIAASATTGVAAWALAGRERGFPAVLSTTVAVQVALHSGFSLVQAMERPQLEIGASFAEQWMWYLLCGATTPTMSGHTHLAMHGMADGMATSAGHGVADMSPTGMLASHLLAALLCGLWLAWGEQAAFRVLRACAGWIVAPLTVVLRPPAPLHRPHHRAVRPRATTGALQQLLLVHAITSRGPPAGTAVI